MASPVYALLAAQPAITALINAPPEMRCFSAGMIPESPTLNAAMPCVTHMVVSGNPANMLARAPSIDRAFTQVNVWALTAVGAKTLMELVRDALEDNGANAMFSTPQDTYESDTKRFGWILEFDFWVPR